MHVYDIEGDEPTAQRHKVRLTRRTGGPALIVDGNSVVELMPNGMLRLPTGNERTGLVVGSHGCVRVIGHPDPADVRALVELVEKFTTPGGIVTNNDVDALRRMAIKVRGQLS